MPSAIKFHWEEKVKALTPEVKKELLNILWINDLDDHSRARLRYVLQRDLQDDDNVMGLIPMEELERREKAETEYTQ
jgi:hypothetical protein